MKKGKAEGVPENVAEQEMLGFFGQLHVGPNGMSKLPVTVDSADRSRIEDTTKEFDEWLQSDMPDWLRAIDAAEAGDVSRLMELLPSLGGPGILLAELLTRKTLSNKKGGQFARPISERGWRTERQAGLVVAEEEFRERERMLRLWLDRAKERRTITRLEKEVSGLEGEVADAHGIKQTTFANHMKGSHGPTVRAKSKKKP